MGKKKYNYNLHDLLGNPDSSENFESLEVDYEGITVYVSGELEVRTRDFKIPYDGNLISGGYTETEIVSIKVYIDDLFIFDKDDNEIEDERLKEKVIKDIENSTNY